MTGIIHFSSLDVGRLRTLGRQAPRAHLERVGGDAPPLEI